MKLSLATIAVSAALAASALAQTNAAISRQGTNVVTRTNATLTWSNAFRWNNTTNAATTISNLFASNSLPSGAAAAGSALQADGSGGSAWVASRVDTRGTTADQSRTNWSFNGVELPTNNDTQLGGWALDANSTYRIDYFIEYSVTTNALALTAGFGFSTNLSPRIMRSGYGLNTGATLTGIVPVASSTSFAIPTTGGTTVGSFLGGTVTIRTAAANTMHFRWAPAANTNAVLTLHSNSVISVTKLHP